MDRTRISETPLKNTQKEHEIRRQVPVNAAATGQVPRPLRIVLTEFRLQIEPTSERCEAGNLISKTLDFVVFDVWFGSRWKMHGKPFGWVFYFRAESATSFLAPLF